MLLSYIVKRLLQMIPLLLCISVIIFVVIQLPPGDYLTTYIRQKESAGTQVGADEIAALKARYGLDKPVYLQYVDWIWGIISRGDFGNSFQWDMPVAVKIQERLPMTLAVSFMTLIFVWLVSIPIGIYSATHQYSVGDYIVSGIGFLGMSVPGFLLAIFVIYEVYNHTGIAISGMFSYEYQMAPWSWGKVMDMLPRFAVLVLVIGVIGGFLFHMLWEAKGRYILPYFMLMLPMAAAGLAECSVRLKSWLEKKGRLPAKGV